MRTSHTENYVQITRQKHETQKETDRNLLYHTYLHTLEVASSSSSVRSCSFSFGSGQGKISDLEPALTSGGCVRLGSGAFLQSLKVHLS